MARRKLTTEEKAARRMRDEAIRDTARPPATRNTGDPVAVAIRLEKAEERRAADRKRGVASSADPLGLAAPAKVRRQIEKVRAAPVRENGLQHLTRGRNPLPAPLYQIALDVHHLWLTAQGQMRVNDWMKERVDGGGLRLDMDIVGALDADRGLRLALRRSGMGEDAELAVLAICGEGMTIMGYALTIEADPKAVGNGGCSRSTLDYVSKLLRGGLERLGRAHATKGDSAVGPEVRRIKAWLGDGARTDIAAAKVGNRPELVQPGGAIHRRA